MSMERMDPELKAKWIAALRSGEYEQCRGKLHNGSGFCCVGVFGDLLGIDRAHLRRLGGFIGPAGGFVQALSPLEAIDLSTRRTLAQMNDRGATFPEIADWIEENL